MFDTISHGHLDEDAGWRSALALLIVGFVTTSCWTTVVLVTAIAARHALPPLPPAPPDDEPYILLAADPEVPLEEPAARPPPPPRAQGTPDAEPEPDTPDVAEDPPPLDDPPKDKVVDQAPSQGVVGGELGGDVQGELGGLTGGTGSTLGARLGPASGPVPVPWSDVKVKRRVDVRYPDAARELDLDDVLCHVHVRIDTRGHPVDVRVASCPSVFHASARKSLYAWRFYPARRGTTKVPAQFSLSIRYKLRN